MKHDEEPFESYLESFVAPPPSADIVSRAMCNAGRRRVRRRIGISLGVAVVTICTALISVRFPHEGGAPGAGVSEVRQPALAAHPVPRAEQGLLTRAYVQGGLEALGEQLDQIARRCEPDPREDWGTWSLARNADVR